MHSRCATDSRNRQHSEQNDQLERKSVSTTSILALCASRSIYTTSSKMLENQSRYVDVLKS
ncbi:hypothetical protein BC937DRAFT_90698 [Endogone sp. FLAS-F59071]|nr:hypothetical protein BC937DRAFT_90698 [Endogone sp. FLAS-F59071]|eukprot:RUS16883.1 hypothetical protein BC937DRAFT_90698 [Endogone sp. FLAS-F59071]